MLIPAYHGQLNFWLLRFHTKTLKLRRTSLIEIHRYENIMAKNSDWPIFGHQLSSDMAIKLFQLTTLLQVADARFTPF